MKHFILSAAVALALAGSALAEAPRNPTSLGLSAPIVGLTPVLAANQDALGLDEAQKAAVKEFLATMPAKRMALEDETAALRAELRKAILDNAPVADRETLAKKIGENETQLLMMRSNCVDHWRSVLTPEQFAKLVEMASAN
jgi:Spy/CpxP family protein refolding chaperone